MYKINSNEITHREYISRILTSVGLLIIIGGLFTIITGGIRLLILYKIDYKKVFLLDSQLPIKEKILLLGINGVLVICGLFIIYAFKKRDPILGFIKQKYDGLRFFPTHCLVILISYETILILIHYKKNLLYKYFEVFNLLQLDQLFHINSEYNIPSVFSALQLLAAGCIAIFCSRSNSISERLNWQKIVWTFVGLIFFYMAADEFFQFHERFGNFMVNSNILPPTLNKIMAEYVGYWTIIGFLLAFIVGIIGLWVFWIIFLPCRHLFYLLIMSGTIFIIGAVIIEGIQVYVWSHQLGKYGRYLQMVEEFFEMSGVSLSIYVFLSYIMEINKTAS